MEASEYKRAKDRCRISNADIWRSAVGVTVDQDKSMSSGRTPISAAVEKGINALLARIDASASELMAALQCALPACEVAFDEAKVDLVIRFKSGKQITVERKGIDMLHHMEVYEAPGAALFLYVRHQLPGVARFERAVWTLWRGDFVTGAVTRGPHQSYPNSVDEMILRQVFKRWL